VSALPVFVWHLSIWPTWRLVRDAALLANGVVVAAASLCARRGAVSAEDLHAVCTVCFAGVWVLFRLEAAAGAAFLSDRELRASQLVAQRTAQSEHELAKRVAEEQNLVAYLCHEIRNPLNSVMGHLELPEEGARLPSRL
jgi:signal transduction histidine kinase